MAEFPALPLFTDAYMADTRHLTTLQHGAYLLMLMTAWRMPDCCLPNDDLFLSRICGIDKRAWKRNKEILLSFWKTTEEGKLFQPRLRDERQFVVQLSNKNTANIRARWLKNNNSHYTTVLPNAYQTDTPTPTPTPTPTKDDDVVTRANEIPAFTKIYDFGIKLFPNLAIKNTSEITKWVDAGYDIDLDILPIINRFQGRNIAAWKYFTQMIVEANAERLRPLPQPKKGNLNGNPEKIHHAIDKKQSKWGEAANEYIRKHTQPRGEKSTGENS